jgi:hypothetical protein
MRSELPSRARHVGLTMATYADPNGGSIYPGVATLARSTGLGPRTVDRALEDLRSSGWIVRVSSGAWRSGRADAYRLNLPDGSDATVTHGAKESQSVGATATAMCATEARIGRHGGAAPDHDQLNYQISRGSTGEERDIEAEGWALLADESGPLPSVSSDASGPPPPRSPVRGLADLTDKEERQHRARHDWDNREQGLDRHGDPLPRRVVKNRRHR